MTDASTQPATDEPDPVPERSPLAELLANTADEMKLQLAKVRTASGHAGLKGTGAEEILAAFLQARLPKSLAVTAGHLVDASGMRSRQVDVIIYDALRTPMIFESALNGWNVVPAEGAVAVIEVKMHLTKADLDGVIANCQSVMSLSRSAYVGPPSNDFSAYGSTWSELPIYYSLFAFESDNTYSDALNDLQEGVPAHQLIDSVCYLDRGVSLHYEIEPERWGYSFMATPLNLLVDVDTSNALLVWLTSLLSVATQAAAGRPIDLMRYAQQEHQLQGSLPKTTPERGRERVRKVSTYLLSGLGLPEEMAEVISQKVFAGTPLADSEISALTGVGVTVLRTPEGAQRLSFPRP